MITKLRLRPDTQDAIIKNRASGVPAADRVGYFACVQFIGPRGRKFRPTIGKVRLTIEEALADVEQIETARYRQTVIRVESDVLAVNAHGEVVG